VVLGIDAAWTAHQPSGVALVKRNAEGWSCVALAPSYASFLTLANGTAIDWSARAHGDRPDMAALLTAAERLTGRPVDLLAFDMPLSTEPVKSRRAADRQVSQRFGNRGCAVHSPMPQRPGAIADDIRESLEQRGYALRTAMDQSAAGGVIEVYPHVALLALLNRHYRLPYKVSRSQQYWKTEALSVQQRIERLLAQFQLIHDALVQKISGIDLPMPNPGQIQSLAALKPLEDCLDALVCAWVGMENLQGRTRPLGDVSAAIWCPEGAFMAAQGLQP
jgi:predicted RNase H-like nuclease